MRRNLLLILFMSSILSSRTFSQTCNDCSSSLPINNSLVVCLPFTGNATDGSGNSNHGTVNSATLSQDRFGITNNAYSFSGISGSYISVPPSPSLNTATMNNVSASVWFYSAAGTTLTSSRTILMVSSTNNVNYAFIFDAASSKVTYYNYNFPLGSGIHSTFKPSISNNTWYHLVFTIDSTNRTTLYFNGIQDTTFVSPIYKPNNPSLSIGRNPNTGAEGYWPFLGRIDEVRMYNRALSACDVSTLHNNCSYITANAGNDTTIMEGDSAQLHATGGTTYAWFPATGLNDTTIANPKASPTVTTTYIVTVSNNICFDRDTVIVTVTSCLPTFNASSDTSICIGDSVQLWAVGADSYQWSPSFGLNDTTIANPKASPTITTSYIVKGTTGSCSKIDTVVVVVNSFVTFSAGADTSVCLNDSIRLAATGATTYKWSASQGIYDTTVANPWVKPALSIDYIVTGFNGTCTAVDTVHVTLKALPIVSAGLDTTICLNDSIQLMATGAGSYKWFSLPEISDTTIANPTVKPLSTTDYVVKGTANGCSQTDTVRVTVTLSSVTFSNDTSICLNDSIQLWATGADSYQWDSTPEIDDTTISNPKAKPLVSKYYFVTVVKGICTLKDSIFVDVATAPTIYAGVDTAVCINNIYTIPAVSNGHEFVWTPSTHLDNSFILNPIFKAGTKTTYLIQVKDTITKCINHDTITIRVSDPPVAGFNYTPENGVKPLTVAFTNLSEGNDLRYEWDFGDTTNLSNDKDPTHTFENNAIFKTTLRIVDSYGCWDTTSANIEVRNILQVFIPNIFSPNGDNLNDVFTIRYDPSLITTVSGSIWNRWGGLVHSFSVPGNGWWDGKSNGTPCSDGIYYYIIETIESTGKKQVFRGTVTLLR